MPSREMVEAPRTFRACGRAITVPRAFTIALRALPVALLGVACGGDTDSSGSDGAADAASVIALSPVAATDVPPSTSASVTLVDGETACTIDSFENQVRCVARDGSEAGVFGGQGDDPGEFRDPGVLARGPGGTVGVKDVGLMRFQVFTPLGALVADLPVEQPLWTPRHAFGADTIVGTYRVAGPGPALASGRTRWWEASALSLSAGETVRTWRPAALPEASECEHLFYGFPAPPAGWVFIDCKGTLSVVDDDGSNRGVRSPTWTGEHPNERDVAARVREQRESWSVARRSIAEGYAERGRPPPAARRFVVDSAALDEYRQRPKIYYLLQGRETIDAQGRVWMPTRVDRAVHSYIDVFSLEPEYLGTVRVVDRMIDYDVLNGTLVVLVEGAAPEGSRRIDWYELPEVLADP